ncbi:Uncharacterised protein [Chlamydia trachomatis]|nr:Uncharacterised protein [Chlamydia trachomatis]
MARCSRTRALMMSPRVENASIPQLQSNSKHFWKEQAHLGEFTPQQDKCATFRTIFFAHETSCNTIYLAVVWQSFYQASWRQRINNVQWKDTLCSPPPKRLLRLLLNRTLNLLMFASATFPASSSTSQFPRRSSLTMPLRMV